MRRLILAAIFTSLTVAQSQDLFATEESSSSKLVLVKTINGAIAPKSVLASNTGLVSAHNMMYRLYSCPNILNIRIPKARQNPPLWL